MEKTTMDQLSGSGARRHAPATLRNREAIAAVLEAELPQSGTVLEIASGSGEHAVFFAGRFPLLRWQPTDADHDALASISAYREEYTGENLLKPELIDAASADWSVSGIDAILCVNMVHITPWEATSGLFAQAERIFSSGAPLILYGPYFESGTEPAQSNVDFDMSLRARDNRWGIRNIEQIDKLAQTNGFDRTARHEMPANNLTLVYRRA